MGILRRQNCTRLVQPAQSRRPGAGPPVHTGRQVHIPQPGSQVCQLIRYIPAIGGPGPLRRSQGQGALSGGDGQGGDILRRQLRKLRQGHHVIDAAADLTQQVRHGVHRGLGPLPIDVHTAVGLAAQAIGDGRVLAVGDGNVFGGAVQAVIRQLGGGGDRRQVLDALHRLQQGQGIALVQGEGLVIGPQPASVLLPAEAQGGGAVAAHQPHWHRLLLLGDVRVLRLGGLLLLAAARQGQQHQRQQQGAQVPYLHGKSPLIVYHRSRPSRAMTASSRARICSFIGPSSRWS